MCIVSNTYHFGKVPIEYLSYRLLTVLSQPKSSYSCIICLHTKFEKGSILDTQCPSGVGQLVVSFSVYHVTNTIRIYIVFVMWYAMTFLNVQSHTSLTQGSTLYGVSCSSLFLCICQQSGIDDSYATNAMVDGKGMMGENKRKHVEQVGPICVKAAKCSKLIIKP